jgi:hypothetical protein
MNKEPRGISGPKREEVTEGWKNYTMRRFIICTVHHILIG